MCSSCQPNLLKSQMGQNVRPPSLARPVPRRKSCAPHTPSALQNDPPAKLTSRGEIPIGCGTRLRSPTRDFVPWRFSAAGPRSAWRDRHSGGRKPAQKPPPALQKRWREVGPPARCNPFPCGPDRDRLSHIAASGDDGCDGGSSSQVLGARRRGR
jgi:hypothetical protein